MKLTPKRATELLRSWRYAAIVPWSDLFCANFQNHLRWMLSLAYCSMFFNFIRIKKNQALIEAGGEDSDLTSSFKSFFVVSEIRWCFFSYSLHMRAAAYVISHASFANRRKSSLFCRTFCREMPRQRSVRKQSIIEQYLNDLKDCKRHWGCLLHKG